jgi:hypothetical protein
LRGRPRGRQKELPADSPSENTRTNVSFTITGTGASFVALSGTAALSLGCGSPASFAFSRFARAISHSSAWSSRFSKPRNFGCRPLGRLTCLLAKGATRGAGRPVRHPNRGCRGRQRQRTEAAPVFAVFEAQEFRLPTARAFDLSSGGGSEASPPEHHRNRGCPLRGFRRVGTTDDGINR